MTSQHLLWGTVVCIVVSSCSGTDAEMTTTDVTLEAHVKELVEVVLTTDSCKSETAEISFVSDLQPEIPTRPLCEPGAGCFGDPCSNNGQCDSGWCVEHMGEKICTSICQEECPAGWTCTQVVGGPDLVYVCVSGYPNLCRPCTDADDCLGVAGTDDACVAYGDQGSFCGGMCAEGTDCPWGFKCASVSTVDGVQLQQCVSETGECPCADTSVSLGLFTECAIANDFGTCDGKRICEESGLSECDAATPAPELCNGIDDDCDGETDEPELLEGKYLELCDDNNDCTDDACAGEEGCVNAVLDAGTCDDGNPCSVADHCDQGVCIGDPVECDDGNECTDNVCTQTGGCDFPPNTEACDDGNPCTLADQCVDGACVGTDVPCDCQADADCGAIEDGDQCNGTLVCDMAVLPYECVVDPSTVVTCPEPEGGNAFCLQAACDPATGDCGFVPAHEGFLCDNGNACTAGDKCQEGVCSGGVDVNCNDGNPCTDDLCAAESGCIYVNTDIPCNDANLCTLSDKCADGQCVGGPALVCNDGNLCNGLETCDPDVGCTDGVPLQCDDGNPCTGLETCHPELGCQPGEPLACDDGNQCTDDSCHPQKGCEFVQLTGQQCNDNNACTELDICQDGVCIGGGEKVCPDDTPCTDNFCDPATGCVTKLNQALCDDGDICTTGDHCHLGECIHSGALTCNDDNVCTDDSCDPVVGCTFAPNQAECDDNNACTEGEVCGGGWCIPGTFLDCDDGNTCTEDTCEPQAGCVNDVLPDGAPCSNEMPGAVCSAGECVCQPTCVGKECGDDACGGSCGECLPLEDCNAGQCENIYGLKWMKIPQGTFQMGCSPGDTGCSSNEKPVHSVTLSSFEMLETEVTEAQYKNVIGNNPSCALNGGGVDAPVECATWHEAKVLCNTVGGRLPTESEWEYAARGGTTTRFYCGDNSACLDEIAWYTDNSGGHKHNVKLKAPNAYGLHDMLGNVRELTADWCSSDYYAVSPPENPPGPNTGLERVERGGAWTEGGGDYYYYRVSNRNAIAPSVGSPQLGFRCARTIPGACQPDCDGKECGDDGCGGSCGECASPQDVCVNFNCACEPVCNDKKCGDDGCGGNCGVCEGGWQCNEQGVCECFPQCEGKECGDNGCEGSCGQCGEGQECNAQGACISFGGWTDLTSDLTWQNPPAGWTMKWSEAVFYCDNLTLAAHSDWRLPTIGELRSLIRGCPATVSGGICEVDDDCLLQSCVYGPNCYCDPGGGPAAGCYWPNEVQGNCGSYWSSSGVADNANFCFSVQFHGHDIGPDNCLASQSARCVR